MQTINACSNCKWWDKDSRCQVSTYAGVMTEGSFWCLHYSKGEI